MASLKYKTTYYIYFFRVHDIILFKNGLFCSVASVEIVSEQKHATDECEAAKRDTYKSSSLTAGEECHILTETNCFLLRHTAGLVWPWFEAARETRTDRLIEKCLYMLEILSIKGQMQVFRGF